MRQNQATDQSVYGTESRSVTSTVPRHVVDEFSTVSVSLVASSTCSWSLSSGWAAFRFLGVTVFGFPVANKEEADLKNSTKTS